MTTPAATPKKPKRKCAIKRRKTAQPNAKSGWRRYNVPAWAKTMPLAEPYNANCNADI